MTTPQVFVSHNHNDNDYCRAFVEALRQALDDARDAVWYDEHNLGWGELQQVIDCARPIWVQVKGANYHAALWEQQTEHREAEGQAGRQRISQGSQ